MPSLVTSLMPKGLAATLKNKGRQTGFARAMTGLVATLLWMFFSSLLIILNKNLYVKGFAYPFFVTGMGQLFSALGGYCLVAAGFLPCRPVPPLRFCASNLLPIILSSSATMFFGNMSYLYLQLTFIQIMKAFTPALTLLLAVLAGLERFRWPLVLSVALIALGTTTAVLVESGTPAFHFVGLMCFMASSVTEAMRVVGAEVMLAGRGQQPYNSAEALVFIGGPTAVLLLLGSWLWEGGIMQGAWVLMAEDPVAFFAAFFMSFLVNLSCFFAIQTTSSLTFKVAGCVKNLAVVWYGVVQHGEHVSLSQMLGYMVSVMGFAMYSRLKMKVMDWGRKRQQRQQQQQQQQQLQQQSKSKAL